MIRLVCAIFFATATFFALNFSWTHAAFAGLVATENECPSELKATAKRRVKELFASVRASPLIFCLDRPSIGLAVSHGTTRFAPFLPSIIVLGPKGQIADVASHEFAHAEIASRTSALLRSYKIPTWFDEELAMQLDQRTDYAHAALKEHVRAGRLQQTRLAKLRWPRAFFRPDEIGKAYYAFSKCVVGGWLRRVGRPVMMQTLAAVSWWSRFPVSEFSIDAEKCKGQPA